MPSIAKLCKYLEYKEKNYRLYGKYDPIIRLVITITQIEKIKHSYIIKQ